MTATPPQRARGDLVRSAASGLAARWWQLLAASAWAPPPGAGREVAGRYLPALVSLAARHLDQPSAALSAVYRDELQRYDLQLSPGDSGGRPAAELAAAQRRAFSEVLGRDAAPVLAALAELNAPLLAAPREQVTMLMLGDCLMNEVRCFLADTALRSGVRVRGYHAYFSGALSAVADLSAARDLAGRCEVELVALSPFTYDALPVYREFLIRAGEAAVTDSVIDGIAGLAVAVTESVLAELRSFCPAPVLLHGACGAPVGPARAALTSLPPHGPGTRAALRALNARLAERAAALPGVAVVDEASLAGRLGLAALSGAAIPGPPLDDDLFHPTRLGAELAPRYWDAVRALLRRRQLKALAVDLDGTLWQGVMAEGSVRHFRDRQELLRRLGAQGIALIALSRGAPHTLRWDELAVAPGDFAVLARGWQPKAASLAAALAGLGIRPAQAAVIDDSPEELALLAAAFPDLAVLSADSPATWQDLELLSRLAGPATREARGRTRAYQAGRARQRELRAAGGLAAGMRQLGMRLTVRELAPGDVPRVLELQQRTNQFSTSGLRLTPGQLRDVAAGRGGGRAVHVAELSDRFGDFGLIAAVVVARQPGPVIESFVMSCRAMGYGAELAILGRVLAGLPLPVSARIVETRLNEPCHGLYAAAGFRDEGNGSWNLAARRSGWVPEWFAGDDPAGDRTAC